MPLPTVKPERSGWRDLSLNDRHRKWGWDCPATDLDFIEYDNGRAVAIIEYKNEFAAPAKAASANVQALIDVGRRARLPVFGVRYAHDFAWFKVKPLNSWAAGFLPETKEMTEKEYVALLYRIRGRPLPLNLFD